MSRMDTGYAGFDEGSDPRVPGLPSELWSLLETISHQIDEADQRHTGLLQELRDRLAMLSRDAEDARADVPESSGPAYARIEDGLAELAHCIDQIDGGQMDGGQLDSAEIDGGEAGMAVLLEAPVPAPLKSAATAPGSAFNHAAETKPASMANPAIDPFDIVGDPEDAEESTDWAADDAEALTRVYEESDAALVRMSPRSESPVSEEPPAPEAPVASDPLGIYAGPAPDEMPASVGLDRAWLDQRLSEIALRIEQSLAELDPNVSMDSLGSRFDAFEERMGSVLGDVATRTDVESLRVLEDQIHELAAHLEATERQLGRLDSIEQQLQAVIDHLSEEAPGAMPAEASAMPDFAALASTAAEEVAQRFAGSMGGSADDQRIDELGSLLRSLIHDRRQNDEQTYTMLDTVQQAMIRLLDRIDALEMAHARSQPEHAVLAVPPVPPPFGVNALANAAPGSVPAGHHEIQDFGAPDHATAEHPLAQLPPAIPAAASAGMSAAMSAVMAAPVSMPERAPALEPAAVPQSPTDRLRQDFIAEAQRAKMRAASSSDAEAEVEPAAVIAQAQRAARGLPRAKPSSSPASAAEVAASGGASRKQRLTALVLCLVIVVSGAALFSKSRNKAAAPPAPAAVTEMAPEIDVPAKPAPVAVDAQAVPAPSAVEGGAFELPADEGVAVPVPAPTPLVGGRAGGPVTNEGVLGPDGEVSEGGEIFEHRPQSPPAGISPEGIILQDTGRKPTGQELAYLQSQQTNATLSSRLGANASRLKPSDLMPEEVARLVTPIAATAAPGQTTAFPAASVAGKTVSPLALPPATVGPLSLRLAAANGDPSAAFEVGARLAEGKGTDQNFKEAMVWYQKSAAQGFAQAQYRLGTLYERGLGVKSDAGRARMWYQRAAEQGNVKAMHNLAVLSAGREGGSPDYATAARWFESAAEYGLADSQYNLAVLYENGLGVAKDPGQAYKWYALAGRSGDKEALRRCDALKAQLMPDVLERALTAVALFSPQRSVPLINDAHVAGEDWKKRQDLGGNG